MAEYLYSRDHQWALREGDRLRVGISDFAQKELGEIAFVELPPLGKNVKQGDPVCSIDSLKSTSEIYAPVSGTVVEVNRALESEQGATAINKDPLGEGWIFILQMADPSQLGALMDPDSYTAFTAQG